MSLNFQTVINRLTSDAFNCVTARTTALMGHNELYHFQMAIKEHGEELVIKETAHVLRDRYRYTFSDAYNEASIRVRALLELCNGDKTFLTVRDNLNAPSGIESSVTI
jgi:hypothetical protein